MESPDSDDGTENEHIEEVADRALRRLEAVETLTDNSHREVFHEGGPAAQTTAALVEAVDGLAETAAELHERAE
jgi:hypothetical protein